MARGFRPWARQVPKMDTSVILLSVPCPERVPPLTLRPTTRWRRLLVRNLCNDGLIGTGPFPGHTGLYGDYRRAIWHSTPVISRMLVYYARPGCCPLARPVRPRRRRVPVSNTGQALDETLDAPTQFVLDSRRVSQERAADGQQLPLPGQLGNTPSANSPHQI